jgi:hypothetical protein
MVMGYESVLSVLRRRGQVPIVKGKPTDLLVPLERQDPVMSDEQFIEFLPLFGRMSFRKVARRLLLSGEQPYQPRCWQVSQAIRGSSTPTFWSSSA